MAPPWLKLYYGASFELFNPSIVFEGQNKAVIKLVGKAARGHSSIAYILVDKNGSHNVTEHLSLHEGIPTDTVLQQMKLTLEKEDK
jgi:hypothetical protein